MKSADVELVVDDDVAILSLNRPQKRNAIRDETIESLGRFFVEPPAGIKAVLIKANGDDFSPGLDLREHRERSASAVMKRSQTSHRVLNAMQFCGLTVVSVLTRTAIGGELGIAFATHITISSAIPYC